MGYLCPYCKLACFDNGEITKVYYFSYNANDYAGVIEDKRASSSSFCLKLSCCPNCEKVSVQFGPSYLNEDMKFSFSYPPANTISIPDYVPSAIRSDYFEAASIADLSPKAAATLARRCLQGMIHDFWDIKAKNLNQEISELRGKVPESQWKAIDGLRKVGNIGAHMEKDVELIIDVDPDEAKTLIKLIELLIEKWYIARHDEEQLLAEINGFSEEKESERKSIAGGQ